MALTAKVPPDVWDGVDTLRDVFHRPHRHGWSTFTQPLQEIRQWPADGRLPFVYGYQVVLGDFAPLTVSRKNPGNDLRVLARETRFHRRYHPAHSQIPWLDAAVGHAQAARNASMVYYCAKPGVLALKTPTRPTRSR